MVRDPWWYIWLFVVCLTIAAVDTSDVPVFSAWWWPVLYGVAAVSLIMWRWGGGVVWLETFGAFLIVASSARGFVRIFAEPRYGSAVLNVLIALLAYDFVKRRQVAPYHYTRMVPE